MVGCCTSIIKLFANMLLNFLSPVSDGREVTSEAR